MRTREREIRLFKGHKGEEIEKRRFNWRERERVETNESHRHPREWARLPRGWVHTGKWRRSLRLLLVLPGLSRGCSTSCTQTWLSVALTAAHLRSTPPGSYFSRGVPVERWLAFMPGRLGELTSQPSATGEWALVDTWVSGVPWYIRWNITQP